MFKSLFISTLVYDASKDYGEPLQIPKHETVTFEFNVSTKTVTMVDLQLYTPKNNPFYKYAQNAGQTLSVEAIGLEDYSFMNSDKKIKDFYDMKQMTAWKERTELENEKSIDDKAGIYMLFDAINNEFYVGKANSLKSRLEQHANSTRENDITANFTHYRYSVISGEYLEFIYLIENAAIHDCAWLINMPEAKNFKPALSKKMNSFGKQLEKTKMINVHEHQTRSK